ncbi:MAG: HAMP domain-containing histidine kinase [Planctomycetaceae bacterium]|nr:HAMP domain-containing histidine kinase [Planctomycetaceae bacterium]
MFPRRSLGWPITLGVVMIVLIVLVIIGWVFAAAVAAQTAGYWWVILAVGATFLGLVLVGVVLYLLISIKEINLNQRQSNFIDSVTHELKSPIASMKLYLQTLKRRQVSEQQQADFYRFMLDDLERLDTLINHMLEAARVEHQTKAPDEEIVDVDLSRVLEECAQAACQRHSLPSNAIALDLRPAIVRARTIDVDMIFRNLIDNALKYGGTPPEVHVEMWPDGRGRVITRVADNGPGIPLPLRRKIFGRFVRLGSELERAKTGTGLGLFIVRTLVKRWKGKITVQGRGSRPGTVFEVDLPGKPTEPDRSDAAAPAQGAALNPHSMSSP